MTSSTEAATSDPRLSAAQTRSYASHALSDAAPAGENQWRPIEGTITTTETSTPYDLVRIVTYLTDDAEEAQGH